MDTATTITRPYQAEVEEVSAISGAAERFVAAQGLIDQIDDDLKGLRRRQDENRSDFGLAQEIVEAVHATASLSVIRTAAIRLLVEADFSFATIAAMAGSRPAKDGKGAEPRLSRQRVHQIYRSTLPD